MADKHAQPAQRGVKKAEMIAGDEESLFIEIRTISVPDQMGLVVYTEDARSAYQNGTVEMAFGGRSQHAEKDEAIPLGGDLGHPRGGCPIDRFGGVPAVGIQVP